MTCKACGKKNRVKAAHLAASTRCGACKTALTPIAEPIAADAATFDEIVTGATVPVLVDFWAAWCAPCRRAAPEVARAASQMAGRAIVLKVDTDAHPEVSVRYGVQGIPNFVVLKNGRVVHQQAGLVDAAQMVGWLADA
jgi:thioredoxin 2